MAVLNDLCYQMMLLVDAWFRRGHSLVHTSWHADASSGAYRLLFLEYEPLCVLYFLFLLVLTESFGTFFSYVIRDHVNKS